MEITKIVITGGPCAGKSTAMSRIQNDFSKLGYTVLFVPETATELITGGINPVNDPDFQTHLFRLQLLKEEIYEDAARKIKGEKALIVCDRGIIDNKVYMSKEKFNSIMNELGKNETRLRDEYDAVFHLVTAAKGAEAFYTTANNTARTETPEQAAHLDDELIAAWTGHPHLRVIDNSCDFEEKMNRLTAEIAAFLGEPEPYEIERKFLIEYPDIKWLEGLENCKRVEIIQTYLNSEDNEEVRVRQRGTDGNYVYYKTVKRKVTALKRVEIEQRLTQEEYLTLLMNADTTKRQIRKTRYLISYKNCYLELDVYPFWKDKAILEIELSAEDAPVEIPEEIKVIKEVTDDESYRNASLAQIK